MGIDFSSDIGNSDVKKAYKLAEIAHWWQKRKLSDEKYFDAHPVKVADIILEDIFKHKDEYKNLTEDDIQKIELVAYLHDIVEDTNIGLDKIKEIFGYDIMLIVGSLSKDMRLRSILDEMVSNGEITKEELKIQMLTDSLRRINLLFGNNKYIAGIVRTADIMQNIDDFDKQDPKFKKRNIKKAGIIYNEFEGYIPLADRLKEKIRKCVIYN